MAEVTWKATLIGALILFLIGLVVATCLNYAEASLNSITAGLDGPFRCDFESMEERSMRCNSSNPIIIRDCIYIFVSYTDNHGVRTNDIKLSLTYLCDKTAVITSHHILNKNGTDIPLGKCSADYCGKYKYTTTTNECRDNSEKKLMNAVNKARTNDSGQINCFLNPKSPKSGAYLSLNDGVKKPEHRMFRYYEAWIILILPIMVMVVIILSLCILYFRGDLAASPIERPKEAFIPPGFQPPTSSAQGSVSSLKDSQKPVHV